jgi:hypothetical protein
MLGSATISPCGRYRYALERRWSDGNTLCVFVMLNPSTADAQHDDPTIRRCLGFAERWGYPALRVVNLYAFRATKPADLWRAANPIGPDNDAALIAAAKEGTCIVLAWGAHGSRNGRGQRVEDLLRTVARGLVVTLGRTRSGEPKHPLYLANDTTPDPGRRP